VPRTRCDRSEWDVIGVVHVDDWTSLAGSPGHGSLLSGLDAHDTLRFEHIEDVHLREKEPETEFRAKSGVRIK
jgi:hypothetical protein